MISEDNSSYKKLYELIEETRKIDLTSIESEQLIGELVEESDDEGDDDIHYNILQLYIYDFDIWATTTIGSGVDFPIRLILDENQLERLWESINKRI